MDLPFDISPDELIEVLSTLYRKIGDRDTLSLQSNDVIFLVSKEYFPILTKYMIKEICDLNNLPYAINKSEKFFGMSDVLDFVTDREYVSIGTRFSEESLKPSDEIKLNKYILYELTNDLLVARMNQKSMIMEILKLDDEHIREKKLLNDIKNSLSSISIKLGFTISPDETLNQLPTILLKFKQEYQPTREKIESDFLYTSTRSKALLDVKFMIELRKKIDALNNEYKLRWNVLLRRLDVTVECFLGKTSKVNESEEEILNILDEITHWRCSNFHPKLFLWDLYTAKKDLFIPQRYVKSNDKSVIKSVFIGQVENRGGIPEGYTMRDIKRDVEKANQSLQQKNQHESDKNSAAPKSVSRIVYTDHGPDTNSNYNKNDFGSRAGNFENNYFGDSNKQGLATNRRFENVDSRRQFKSSGPTNWTRPHDYGHQYDNNIHVGRGGFKRNSSTRFHNNDVLNSPRIRGSGFGGRPNDRPPTNQWNPRI